MPTEFSTWLAWFVLGIVSVSALVYWWRARRQEREHNLPVVSSMPAPEAPRPAAAERGRDFKKAVGSAGIKSVVREGRMEEAYQVRSGSDTAFEAYADFDTQQERVALVNRSPGPSYLALSQTLDARSALNDGLGNRHPAEVWTMREEWMPAISHFVKEAAFQMRAAGVWPARITAHLSAGGHGLPGLYALHAAATEFPRADRHAHLIVPEGDIERSETICLLEALRRGVLAVGEREDPLPWLDERPLALATVLRDNRRGRDDLDDVAAHIGPALSARVRFETSTSENLSNLMRRLAKETPDSALESCPLTFHHAGMAVPIARPGAQAEVDLATLLPLADATLRAIRQDKAVTRALDVNLGRHLLLVTMPCNDWADVQRVERYVLERLWFYGQPDRQCIGVFFSGYRPDPDNREERVLAIKLGAVAGGWDAVYGAIGARSPRRRIVTVHDDQVDGVDDLVSHRTTGKRP